MTLSQLSSKVCAAATSKQRRPPREAAEFVSALDRLRKVALDVTRGCKTAADKAQIAYDNGHFTLPPNRVAADVTDWFDRYLGRADTPR